MPDETIYIYQHGVTGEFREFDSLKSAQLHNYMEDGEWLVVGNEWIRNYETIYKLEFRDAGLQPQSSVS